MIINETAPKGGNNTFLVNMIVSNLKSTCQFLLYDRPCDTVLLLF